MSNFAEKNAPRGCKAPVALVMHRPEWNVVRTRRKGRWLPKQPRLGARMCQGTFFFYFNETMRIKMKQHETR